MFQHSQPLTDVQMLDHAGMFEKSRTHLDLEECRRDPERAWEEWKEIESRHRYGLRFVALRSLLMVSPGSLTPGSPSIKK